MPGYLITIEGIDGAGKTTQAALLGRYLTHAGYAVLATHEPGGTPLGDKLREIVLGQGLGPTTAAAELFLYLAARAEHVARVIRPALERGLVVLCDRFSDSTLVYQGCGRGLDFGLLTAADALATGGLRPDLTIILDLPVEEAQRRLAASGRAADRLEAEGAEFLQRLRLGYLALAREDKERRVLVEATGPAAAVFARVRNIVETFLREKAGLGDALTGPFRPRDC
ncbi:MAG: dTMP kinase [Clostridia bacterium]|nr:dTMP kinase [Clostridia bacterium]MBC7346659.1 dTMP kinase [Clostridia bacterium]